MRLLWALCSECEIRRDHMDERTLGERWVLYVAGKASIWWAVACILVSIVYFYKYFSSIEDHSLYLGFMWIFLALVWFERSLFGKFIEKQQTEIEKLKSITESN
jgi:hypothetical protein